MKPRGIENILLRRVRRHQSMTALFRAPDAGSGKPRRPQALPVIQKQEQDLPIDAPVAEAFSSHPVTPTHSNAVARQVIPPSASTHQPLSPIPSASSATELAKTPDPVWKRLQTIFRKHQEQNNPSIENTADMEGGTIESIQTQAHEEPLQRTTTEEHILPTRNQEMAVPASRGVQRSPEHAEPKSEPVSMDVQHKVQTFPPTSPEIKRADAARNIELRPVSPDQRIEVNDQASIANEPEEPSLPLESVWNVQRVEAQHPLFRENIYQPTVGSPDVNEDEIPAKTSQAHDQKSSIGSVQLHREDEQPATTSLPNPLPISGPAGESRGPVEILSPSRPRPPQLDSHPHRASIQRQSQDTSPSKEISEAPSVNTAIGPLPADLWWLLGQKPPSAAPAAQPDIQRTIHPDQKQTPLEQNNIANPHISVEHPAETPILPNMIQRQIVSNAPLPSNHQEPVSPPHAEETKHAESTDLDDLARRVYAEVRRRLAAEWERRR